MLTYVAPAKVNLALHVEPPRSDGYHPLDSLVQTIEWCDTLTFSEGEGSDSIDVEGEAIEPEKNLVTKALGAVRAVGGLRPQAVTLQKDIPVGAGLGGGSSDAAAALTAAGKIAGFVDLAPLALKVGADVPLFLTGGTLMMRGIGEVIEPLRPLGSFALAVAVPDFGLDTGDVYARWDQLEGPRGDVIPVERLPPALRDGIPIRNDLTPAALDLEPRLGDFMADLRSSWEGPVAMTGSGSGCFGFFATLDEAQDAAKASGVLVARGVELRPRGVAIAD